MAVLIVPALCTGVDVTLAETIVMVRGALAPTSRMENVWEAPAFDGNRPSFSVATLALSAALTTSTPSTVSTVAPRSRFAGAVVAGEPGSVYATLMRRGGFDAITRNSAP